MQRLIFMQFSKKWWKYKRKCSRVKSRISRWLRIIPKITHPFSWEWQFLLIKSWRWLTQNCLRFLSWKRLSTKPFFWDGSNVFMPGNSTSKTRFSFGILYFLRPFNHLTPKTKNSTSLLTQCVLLWSLTWKHLWKQGSHIVILCFCSQNIRGLKENIYSHWSV